MIIHSAVVPALVVRGGVGCWVLPCLASAGASSSFVDISPRVVVLSDEGFHVQGVRRVVHVATCTCGILFSQ